MDKKQTIIATLLLASGSGAFNQVLAAEPSGAATVLEEVLVTAEQQSKQALGYSKISKEDLENHPVSNDLSQIIRTMPGVNLTNGGNSGQRGNNRQIDLRGMGPDNTLILIDGRPVLSREATRLSWRGERDTRGDSNWVPAEMVESIEVIRGPAAARYGDGAAGGVVNIITKKRFDKLSSSVTAFVERPEDSLEGAKQRYNFNLMGPLNQALSFRVYGNYSRSDADDVRLNAKHSKLGDERYVAAGNEGVKNQDVNALLAWNVNNGNQIDIEASWGRQKNIFAGDQQNSLGDLHNEYFKNLIGNNSNIMTRTAVALTHRGDYDKFTTKSYLQYDKTANDRIDEGLFGAWEGAINQYQNRAVSRSTATLKNWNLHTETSFPIEGARIQQNLTMGADYKYQKLYDANSTRFRVDDLGPRAPSEYPAGFNHVTKQPNIDKKVWGIFIENNMVLNDNTTILPGLRLNHDSYSGFNLSPSLNIWQKLNDQATLKFGVARAYKSPNLYQLNPNYLMFSSGIGCWNTTRCFLMGNKDLKAETSINYEIGLDFKTATTQSNLTYFYNDYKNKIDAGINIIPHLSSNQAAGARVFQWENIDAKIQGLEGSFKWDISPDLQWRNNFTYMLDSKNKETGDYLTIIPKYTINTSLDWHINDRAMLGATGTVYGKQRPRRYNFKGAQVVDEQTSERGAYAVFGVVGKYDFNKTVQLHGGVRNLFNKQLYRQGNAEQAGAHTYNEPGRSYYLGLTAKF